MDSDPRSHDTAPPGGIRISAIPEQFGGDPARILTALWESQAPAGAEREFLLVLSLNDARNIVFPPHEGEARWRYIYARARGRTNGMGSKLTSPIYFSASRERMAGMVRGQSILTYNLVALTEEIGTDALAELPTPPIALTDAPRTDKALRAAAAHHFAERGFEDRPAREWGRFLIELLIEFYPAAAEETRIDRYPWEAGNGEPISPFLHEVRHKAQISGHDPADALLSALALS